MKKIRLLLATGLLSGALCAQVTHVTQFNGKEFDFSKSKTVVEEQNYTKFDLPIYPMKAIPGNPELPVKYVRLLIPPGQEVTDITINFQEANSYKLENVVYPIQEPVPVGETAENFTLPNMDIYNADKPYPENVVELVSSGFFNGSAHVATFAVYPVQYYPTSNTLTEFSSVTFTVATSTPKLATKKPIAPNANNLKKYNSLLEQMVDNPADINKYKTETFESTIKSGVAYFEYVIITSSTLSTAFTNFIAWKRLKGFDIGLVTWQDIRANYPSGDLISGINDNAGSIRQYLKDAWQHGTVYCLIGGDMTTVPARYGCGTNNTWTVSDTVPYRSWHIDNYKIPTDLYYSDFNGDWNVDGDEFTGEITEDDVEFASEIFVGRLLCSTASHVNTWFTKLKLYENNPGNGDFGYLNKVLFTEADGLMSSLCRSEIHWTTDITTISELPSGGSLNPTYPSGPDVINAANNHYGLMSWFNHGSPHAVAMYTVGYNQTINDTKSCIVSTDAWDISHGTSTITESGNGFNNLTNENYPSIVYTISCDNNPFDEWHTDAGYPNMGEAFTSWNSGGGPAYIGNSRYGYPGTSHDLMNKFLDAIQMTVAGNNNLHIGIAESKSKQHYYDHYIGLSNNLIGCPETPFWLEEPNTMHLSVDYTNNKIRMYKADGTVLSGAKVSFNYGGTYYFDTTDASGYAYAPYDLTEAHEVGGSYPGYLPVYTQHVDGGYWSSSNPIRGNVIVASSSYLNLIGNLTIPKYSKLIIEDNATVTLNSGLTLTVEGDIEFRGVNSKLIVNGSLNIKGSSTISGSGYLYLNGNINAEPGANLTIEGEGQSTKLLEVNSKIEFDTDFASITIKDGLIEMNGSDAGLYINSEVDNVSIDNVLVCSPESDAYNGHQGINILSDGTVTVKNSTFKYGYYGLCASREATAPIIIVEDCSFQYNTYGLRAYNGGVGINECTFMYNTYRGLYCSSMDKQSYINNSTIKYQNGSGDYGLYYHGESTARLSLYSTDISYNYYGAYINGSFTSSIKCSSIANNTEYGVYAYNTDIYLAGASGISGGSNFLYSNKYALRIYGSYASFYLNNGYNDLRSDSYCVYGSVSGVAGGYIACYNNYWKTGGGTPVYLTNYNVTGAGGSTIYLTDYSPESSYQPCLTVDPIGLSMSVASVEETIDYREVNTSIGDLALNVAVDQILNTDAEAGTVYDANTQYELISEVLMNDLDDLNPYEDWYVKHAYRMFKSDMGSFENDKNTDKVSAKQMDKMLNVIAKLEKDAAKGTNKLSKYAPKRSALFIDKANMLWYNGKYDQAIELLSKLQNKVNASEVCEINKMICRIKVDRAFIESNNTLEIDEALAVCEECDESRKSATLNNNGDDGMTNETLPSEKLGWDDYSLNIIPNPISSVSEIRIKGYEGGEMLIYNSVGQIISNKVLPSNNYTQTISATQMDEGIYMVVVSVNGKAVQTQKMVVVK